VIPGKRSALRGPIWQTYDLVVRGHRGRWLVVAALALVVSGLEAVGAGLVFLLLGLITDPGGGVEFPILGDISGLFPDVDSIVLLVGAAVGIGVFFLVRGALQVVQSYVQNRISYNAGVRLGVRLVRGYLAMPYSYHVQRESAILVRNAISSVQEIIRRVVLPAAKFVAEIMVVAGISVVLFATAPVASLLVVAVLGPMTYLVLRMVKARVKRYGRLATDSAQESLQILQESLHGIRDIRLLGREGFFIRMFRRQRNQDAKARASQATFSELTSVLIELLLVSFIVTFLVVTVLTAGTAGESFAVLGLFAYVAMRLKPSIQKIISAANNLRFATPAIDDLYRDLEETEAALEAFDMWKSPEEVVSLHDKITVEDVSFRYRDDANDVLQHVNLEIVAGESVGLCGPTGGGKSTLVDILAGLLEPTAGHVMADGSDIHQDVRRWQRRIGFVSQDMYLFDDTLLRNIALGVPDDRIDEGAVRWAVEMAQLEEFVTTLPKGLDTEVGEHGTLLSGGQRQRVAIARALYRDPDILFLDEGTSALDNETERHFIEALQRFQGRKTLILVAHRLSTIRNCDRVYFVDNGRVAGGGSYDELYEENPAFRRMAV
jgi:ATP-binding cassette, subfamily B, bacterial PglK